MMSELEVTEPNREKRVFITWNLNNSLMSVHGVKFLPNCELNFLDDGIARSGSGCVEYVVPLLPDLIHNCL